jgi:hypothetical protein
MKISIKYIFDMQFLKYNKIYQIYQNINSL